LEFKTQSPFGEPPHVVVARQCGINRCRATTPCLQHDQVVVRLAVDGVEHSYFNLSKPAFVELTELHRDPRELFHMLADYAVLADGGEALVQKEPSLANFMMG
jgi:hypothetical protein